MLAGFLPSIPYQLFKCVCFYCLSNRALSSSLGGKKRLITASGTCTFFFTCTLSSYHTAQLYYTRAGEVKVLYLPLLVFPFAWTSSGEKRKLWSLIPEPPLASFPGVVAFCATVPQKDRQNTWIRWIPQTSSLFSFFSLLLVFASFFLFTLIVVHGIHTHVLPSFLHLMCSTLCLWICCCSR